ncbi:hypothetical protein ACQ4M3_20775 [Leptolyngbya sp. AN03gr2]|uniref:hypothetical protein n=1 Tax=unclassified Leptolyngbya TaxID=2650499 RepID=UPI003D322F03
MTTGNLIGQRVSYDFTPACLNCALQQDCKTNPKHEAFPWFWHWSHETKQVDSTSKLILASWVGTIAHGEDHTGCKKYKVAKESCLPLTPEQENYRQLWSQLHNIETQLRFYREDTVVWNSSADALQDQWNQICDQITNWEAVHSAETT